MLFIFIKVVAKTCFKEKEQFFVVQILTFSPFVGNALGYITSPYYIN
jgi:hypothetical protein